MRTLRIYLACWVLVQIAFSQMRGSVSLAVRVEAGVPIPMRDKTVLRADVYSPIEGGKYPVLLVRTPYDKASEADRCRQAAQRGYICVAQDVRGRYASDGEWYPFRNELADGYDTVEWAAAFPDSNGQVAMFGESYVGATQWLAAIMHPPHLVEIQPSLTASNYHDGWVYQGGALAQWFDQSWTSLLALEALQRATARQVRPKTWTGRLPESSYPVLPPIAATNLVPYYFDWLAHPAYDQYWKRWSIEEHYSDMSIPVDHVGGWYDIFLRGTLCNYVGMRTKAATPWARSHQTLLIGPWIHDGPKNGRAGDLDFGTSAVLDEAGNTLALFDKFFGKTPKSPAAKPVKIFVMGINQWREEDDWPLTRTRYTRFYLHSAGRANSKSGDGTLSEREPTDESADRFTYDPSKPVPTHGGSLCCSRDAGELPSGSYDQRETESRGDVLVYTTLPLDHDAEVTGPLVAQVYVRSSAEDTDVTAKLVDVWPNGYSQNLADGIQRLRYRTSPSEMSLIKPGTVYKVTIDLAATSNVFRKGHRIRLDISSSNFPRFDRNLNTRQSPEQASKFVRAHNLVFHDAAHPSAIILPLIPQ